MPDQMSSLQRPASLSNSVATASAEFQQVATSLHLTLPPADLCERLLAAVEKAASESSSSMDALRAAVAEFTVALRKEGATPEAVLITLKTLINNRTCPRVDPRDARGSTDPLRQKISTWSIQEFFSGAR
jgi:hypothetical protein